MPPPSAQQPSRDLGSGRTSTTVRPPSPSLRSLPRSTATPEYAESARPIAPVFDPFRGIGVLSSPRWTIHPASKSSSWRTLEARAGGLQTHDVVPIATELEQDLLGVLAVVGRGFEARRDVVELRGTG